MATPRRKKPANAGLLKKDPTTVHEAVAVYIAETVGVEVDPATVALVQRVYPLYLKSPAVTAQKDAERRQREAEKAAKEAARQKKVKERLAKIELDRQRLLKQLGITEPALAVVGAEERFTDDSGVEVEEDVPVTAESEDGWSETTDLSGDEESEDEESEEDDDVPWDDDDTDGEEDF